MSDKHTSHVVVVGLGRFGSSLALELTARGTEVLGIDVNPKIVQQHAQHLTHVVVADTTDEEVMRQLGVGQFQRAVVGIGTDLEASILTTALLVDFQIPHIWAKAVNRQHGRILERMGAHHVVLPEHEMGERVAHLVTGRMLDYIEFEDDYALVKTHAPEEAAGVPLEQSRLRSKYGVTVVGVKRPGEGFTYATADTVVNRGDVLILAGRTADVERVADLT
ncbi:TrkA family potassium uptake protein [Lentzea sp. BCCO 10_0798]|uniref:TrkA family potassium uptake protein n=1 Tax=Lentzea kristufekii TaxID=3095430 RepID=A0ABU4U1B6_9PSEU|nr:TrkA family potassium uptake protein [Lentzea sp. BCCO 10_0798]MDX8054366.1 TrkA family potassium uptake protein [Lentzea sp. BCCO 10_0798]